LFADESDLKNGCAYAERGFLTGRHGVQQDITLQEALCGFSFNITHLDQRILQVRKQQMAVKEVAVLACS